MSQFDKAILTVLKHEGGYSDHVADRGGKTRYGIIESVARRHGYEGAMHLLPLEKAKEIYRIDYWDENRLEDIASVNYELALEVFDTGVNVGTARVARWLQESINVLNRNQRTDLTVDGEIGPATLNELRRLNASDVGYLITIMRIQQGAHYLNLALKVPAQRAFIRGWVNRV